MNQPFRKAVWLFTTFCFSAGTISAQLPAGPRSSAMGNASVALSDVWSAFNNQAGLAWLNGVRAGIFYENRFLLPELSIQGAAVSVPFRKAGVFGCSILHSGYTEYSDSKFGLCYARRFGAVFSIGVQINLHWIHIGDVYGDLVTATGELSFQVNPSPKWVLAAHVFNPTRTPLAEYRSEKINTVFRLGAACRFGDKVTASVEVEASVTKLPSARLGAEYRPSKTIFLRAGFNAYPLSPAFGFGIFVKKFQIDAAASWYPLLGFSPQVSFNYDFTK